MVPGLLNKLDDELVMEVVARLYDRSWSWRVLAATCRHLCRLLRDRHVRSVSLQPEDIFQLLRVPSSRAFTTILHVRLDVDIATPQDLATLSKGMWALVEAVPQLRSAELYVSVEKEAREFASLESPILALQGLPSLRSLTLDEVPDSRSYQYFITGFTQLTCLEIAHRSYSDSLPLTCWFNGDPAPPLPTLNHLERLELHRFHAQSNYNAAALPPQLTYLKVSQPPGSLPAWWEQVGRCDTLQELHVELQKPDPTGHPSLLLKQIAGKLTALTSLHLTAGVGCVGYMYEADWPATTPLQRFIIMMVYTCGMSDAGPAAIAAAAGQWAEALVAEEQEEEVDPALEAILPMLERMVQTPLQKLHGFTYPAEHIVLPPFNLKGLSSLQELHTDGFWWLTVNMKDHWEALAACSTLRSLRGLHTCKAPPPGVTFPGVTTLAVTTGTSPGDTVTLLGASPALRELQLVLVPQEEDGSSSERVPPTSTEQPLVLPHLVTASIAVHLGPGAQQLAPYFKRLLPALPGLQRLELGWHQGVDLLPQLPTLAAVSGLSVLQVGWKPELTPGFIDGKELDVPALLRVVRTVPWLQEVEVLTPEERYLGGTEQKLVLGLQEALPALRLVRLRWCSWDEEPSQLPADFLSTLRPGLKVVKARYGRHCEGWCGHS